LAAFVSNWTNYAKLFPLSQSRITSGVNHPGALCSMAALRRAFSNRDRKEQQKKEPADVKERVREYIRKRHARR
jgi:hypothetical protein